MKLHVQVDLPLGARRLQVRFSTTHHVTGVFGPSGCGKTTLLELVAGLRRAPATVRFGDETWQDADRFVPPERRGIGYVPQGSRLFGHLDVRGNLLAGARRARAAGRDPQAMLDEVVELLELGALLSDRVHTLSGGERQRVALGRALCSAPDLLLLDEPLAALDLALKHRVLPFLRRVRAEYEIPMLLVSHDPTEVQALCDDLLVIADGTVAARGAPRTTLADPAALRDGPTGRLEHMMECEIVELGDAVTRVRVGDTQLWCAGQNGAPGQRRLLVIQSRDVIVAAAQPRGLSARNTLPARIEAIDDYPDGHLVSLALGGESGPRLAALISAQAHAALGFAVGDDVFVVIKAGSCTLLPL